MGARRWRQTLFERASHGPGTVTSWVCTDKQAVAACVRFADDHRVLVEPACGAALSAVYERAPPLLAACAAAQDGAGGVVVEVCGGGVVDLHTLSQWASELGVE